MRFSKDKIELINNRLANNIAIDADILKLELDKYIIDDLSNIIYEYLVLKCDECNRDLIEELIIEHQKVKLCMDCFCNDYYNICNNCKRIYKQSIDSCYICKKSSCCFCRYCNRCSLMAIPHHILNWNN